MLFAMKKTKLSVVLFLLSSFWPFSTTALAQQSQLDRLVLGKPDTSHIDKCIKNSWHREKFVRTNYVDNATMPTVSPEQKKQGYVVFQRNWMDLVFPNSIPKEKEITNELKLFASPGEYEPATFCIRTLKELKGLQISATDLVSENGNRIKAPQLSIVRCVPRAWRGEEWIYEDGPVGILNMPSYLEKLRALDVAADRTLQFWATVNVENNAQAGSYEGQILISNDQGTIGQIKLKCKVLPINLVEPPQTLGFWDFQRPYKNEIGTLDQVYQVMSEHGIKGIHTKGGLYTYHKKTDHYDFSKYVSIGDTGKVTVTLAGSSLETSLRAAKNAGFKYVIYDSHLFILVSREIKARYDKKMLTEQTAAEITKVIERFENEKCYEIVKKEITGCSKNYPAMYSQVYADLFVKIVRGLLKEVEDGGYPTLVLPSWDEAFSNHHRNKDVYPFVIRHLELYKRAGAMTELNHCSPFSGGEYGAYVRAAMKYLDIGMPAPRLSSNPLDTSGYRATLPQIVEAFGKEGIATYNYSLSGGAGGVYPDMNISRFCGGFFFHSSVGKGVQGNFDYIYFRVEEDPYNPIAGKNWSHERFWFFPPQPETSRLGGRSITLVAKREGFDDLRYLHTLNKLIEQAQATADMPKKSRTGRRARTVRDKILGSIKISDDILDMNNRLLKSHWDHVVAGEGKDSSVSGSLRLGIGWDHSDYNKYRWAIAQEIIKLQKVLN